MLTLVGLQGQICETGSRDLGVEENGRLWEQGFPEKEGRM